MAMTAGMSVMRTRKASTATPTVRASAIGLTAGMPWGMKAAKTPIMMTAAAVTTFAELSKPSRTASLAWPVRSQTSRMRETRKTW